MKLYLSYVAARDRATGKIFFLAEHNALIPGGVCAQLGHLTEAFRASSEESEALREKYSHVLIVIDNHERASYEFPDPAIARRDQLNAELAHARSEHAALADQVKQAADAAASAKPLDSRRKAAASKVAELERQLQEVIPASIPSTPSKPVIPPEPTPEEKLGALDDEKLALVAAEYGVECPLSEEDLSILDRAAVIAGILAVATTK